MKCKTFSWLAPPMGVDPGCAGMQILFGLDAVFTCEIGDLICGVDNRMCQVRTQAVQALFLQRKRDLPPVPYSDKNSDSGNHVFEERGRDVKHAQSSIEICKVDSAIHAIWYTASWPGCSDIRFRRVGRLSEEVWPRHSIVLYERVASSLCSLCRTDRRAIVRSLKLLQGSNSSQECL